MSAYEAQHPVTRALAGLGGGGAFAVRRRVPHEALALEVRGAGPVRLPVPAAAAKRLCAVARPAPDGYKGETRVDRRVRDTWEVARSRVRIDRKRWNEALRPELAALRRSLGLASGQTLDAQLHSMLVYTPGQFFAPHQDAEKCDDMVATLVVMLPSKARGGSLVVEYHGERKRFRASKGGLTLVAFYADCHHEVKPLEAGHRVVLTFNLVLGGDGPTAAALPSGEALDDLRRAVEGFFDASGASPERLVYLLDHQYTRSGLHWQRLKHPDAARAAALREVAGRLDCEVVLALADVHETWGCEGAYDDGWFGGRRRYFDVVDDRDEDDYELTELCDSRVRLRHFVGVGGRTEAVESPVRSAELLYTKPSIELDPFESEHEPYMGNWGNTVDHWYHRAAVVLWPRERAFLVRARGSALWATREISRAVRAGRIAEATQMVEQILPLWPSIARAQAGARLAGQTLRLAAGLPRADLAAGLAEPLDWEDLTSANGVLLGRATRTHGLAWACALLERWDAERRFSWRKDRLVWLRALPGMVEKMCQEDAQDGFALARAFTSAQWSWLRREYEEAADEPPSGQLGAYTRLERAALGVLEAGRVCEHAHLHGDVTEFLSRGAVPPLALSSLLRAAWSASGSARVRKFGLGALHAHVLAEIQARLDAPVRPLEDWSIPAPAACSCLLCRKLGRFLEDANGRQLEWPLAKPGRKHVHRVIDGHELPVRHVTRRLGRPFTLVLEKTHALFAREVEERAALRKARTWHARRARSFGDEAR